MKLPGSRHEIAAAREHGILDALDTEQVDAVADTGYQGAAGRTVRVPRRRRRLDLDMAATGECRATRRTSTSRTPAGEGPASAPTRAEELEDSAQDPHQPQPEHHSREGRSDSDPRQLIKLKTPPWAANHDYGNCHVESDPSFVWGGPPQRKELGNREA